MEDHREPLSFPDNSQFIAASRYKFKKMMLHSQMVFSDPNSYMQRLPSNLCNIETTRSWAASEWIPN